MDQAGDVGSVWVQRIVLVFDRTCSDFLDWRRASTRRGTESPHIIGEIPSWSPILICFALIYISIEFFQVPAMFIIAPRARVIRLGVIHSIILTKYHGLLEECIVVATSSSPTCTTFLTEFDERTDTAAIVVNFLFSAIVGKE